MGLITTILIPYASERLYINQIELDNSVSARLLKEEIYSSIRGITFYIKEIETDGTLVDILLYDQRNKDEALSYTAKQAFIARDEDKTTLYMQDGLIQSINVKTQIIHN